MKYKLAILGSTGSIGQSTLDIVNKKRSFFKINILSAHGNYKKICQQIIKYKPKIFIIINQDTYLKIKKRFKKKKIKICNNYDSIKQNKKIIDITVSAIPGLAGLEPTIIFTKISKKILLANKEAIICGWSLIKKISKQKKTIIIPLDSEHFSILQLTKNYNNDEIEKIYITASGGPFLKLNKNKFKNIKPNDAVSHPKWKMGAKISVDSATLMNKILELMEALKMFPFNFDKYEIIIHPQSLVHAIVKFKNGLTKFLYHETDMCIPISNAIFDNKIDYYEMIKKKSDLKKNIKNLEFTNVDIKRFPAFNLIKKTNFTKSAPIIINGANEILVDQFLRSKITFNSIYKYLKVILKHKKFKYYANQTCNNLKKIYIIDLWSRNLALEIIKKTNLND